MKIAETVMDCSTENNRRAELAYQQGWRAGYGRTFRGSITDYARTFSLGSGYLGAWAETNLCRDCRGKNEQSGNIEHSTFNIQHPMGETERGVHAASTSIGQSALKRSEDRAPQAIEKCRHFEIETARHLIGPFRAIADPNVRIVMVLKAAQTAGSLVWDLTVHYLLVHSSFMRIKVLMDSDDKATKYCQQRLMETLRRNPDIAPLMPTGSERFGVTDTEMRLLNGKTLFVGGLNESNASSLPADVMILDEGWLHQSDGLMKKAFDRTKQLEKSRKIIVVGQAGNVKEDQDAIWESLHVRVPLTWQCPCCGERQQFELNKKRAEDFVGKVSGAKCQVSGEGREVSPLTAGAGAQRSDAPYHAGQFRLSFPAEPPKPGTYVGFKIFKRFSELNTPEEIKEACAKTVIECYHCGFEIADTPEMRQALNATYEQEYQLLATDGSRYTPPDYSVGFWQPDPASMFVSFRSTMEAYVVAIKAKEQFGNIVPLRDFYLSKWAQPWDPKMLNTNKRMAREDVYDVALAQHNAWRLCMIVDNQQDLMQQWAMVMAVQKNGASRQIWRGPLLGLNAVRKKQLDFGKDAKGHPLLKDQWVFLDGRYKPEQICQHIIESKYGHWATINGERVWACWSLMQGSRNDYQTHADERDKTRKFICGDPNFRGYKVDGAYVEIEVYPFSATACGERFEASRDGKGAETSWLPRQPDEPPDDNELSHHSQIHSNQLVPSKSFEPRAARMKYVPVPASAPDHYFHMWRMFEAVKEKWGVDGMAILKETTVVGQEIAK